MMFKTKDGHEVAIGMWLYDGTEVREVIGFGLAQKCVYTQDVEFDEDDACCYDLGRESALTAYDVSRMFAEW